MTFDDRLRDQFTKTARALAGRDCRIRFEPPVDRGFTGECYLTAGGLGVIDLDPRLPWREAFEVLLHECAHFRLDHVLADDREYLLPAASVAPTRASITAHATNPLETAATTQAKKWALESDEGIKRYPPQPTDPAGWETMIRLIYLETKYHE